MDREKRKKLRAQPETDWINEEEWFLPAVSPNAARKHYYTGVPQKVIDLVVDMHETLPEKYLDDPDVMSIEGVAPYRLRYDKDGRCVGGVVPQNDTSFDHPAKMVPSLAARIIAVYSKPGDWILDPMSGIGTTLVEGMLRDRNCIGIELEPRWAKIGWRNVNIVLKKKSLFLNVGRGFVIQGDARNIPELISEYNALRALFGEEPYYSDLVMFSPPYGNVYSNEGADDDWDARRKRIEEDGSSTGDKRWTSDDPRRAKSKAAIHKDHYGQDEAQIANKPVGKVDLVTFSPPYGDLVGRDRLIEPSATVMDDFLKKKIENHLKYSEGATPDNIGDKGASLLGSVEETMAKSIPGQVVGSLYRIQRELDTIKALIETEGKKKGYIDLVTFSPPYANIVKAGSGEGPHTHVFAKWLKDKYGYEGKIEYSEVKVYYEEFSKEYAGYSTDMDNIGNEEVETYWDSMKKVYLGCLQVLRPGGHCILVTGDYYRDKKRVPLGDDTIALMKSVGFEYLRTHRRIYNNRSYFITIRWHRCDHLKIGRRKEGVKNNKRCSHEKEKEARTAWIQSKAEEAKGGTVDVALFPNKEWCKNGNCPLWVNTLEKIDWEDVLVFRKPL
jgi:DNA modification methylase